MEDLWVRGEDRGKGDGSCGYMPRIESLLSEEIEIQATSSKNNSKIKKQKNLKF